MEAKTDWWPGGMHHRADGGQSAKAPCSPLVGGSRARVTHGCTSLAHQRRCSSVIF
jgi:hypothetical protein